MKFPTSVPRNRVRVCKGCKREITFFRDPAKNVIHALDIQRVEGYALPQVGEIHQCPGKEPNGKIE